ncbi:MAG: hypothetical protein QOE59_1097, partial [Actinomycetota bacterium]|nr:hypothetical protein [Actinomycetota bacterium]
CESLSGPAPGADVSGVDGQSGTSVVQGGVVVQVGGSVCA